MKLPTLPSSYIHKSVTSDTIMTLIEFLNNTNRMRMHLYPLKNLLKCYKF